MNRLTVLVAVVFVVFVGSAYAMSAAPSNAQQAQCGDDITVEFGGVKFKIPKSDNYEWKDEEHQRYKLVDLFDAQVRWQHVYEPLGAKKKDIQQWERAGHFSNTALLLKRIFLKRQFANKSLIHVEQDDASLVL